MHQTLCHPSILSLFSTIPAIDPDSDEGDPRRGSETSTTPASPGCYLVLEYCGPYGTLSDHLPRSNPAPPSSLGLEESRVRGVVKALVDALVYLEREGVVHGRVVPGSVYVTEDFRVVSVDLGGVRFVVLWFG